MYTVMIIDDSETELMMIQKALEKEYSIISMNNSKQALARLNKATVLPDIVILDVALHGIGGFEVVNRIRTTEKLKDIRVMFISNDRDTSTETEAFRLGAVDYIRKPLVMPVVKKKVDMFFENVTARKKSETYVSQLQQSAMLASQNSLKMEYFIIGMLTDLITEKDGYTGMHCMCVSRYMGIILKEMLMSGINYGIAAEDYELILLSSQLHDMGKVGVPDSVLQKVGKYTDEEFNMMKQHTVLAANAIQKYSYLLPGSKFLNYTYQMARYHHERYDGNGYPDKLVGQNIPILARILSVADVYDALVSKRTYKQPCTHEQAYNIITQGAGIQFDPAVVSAFQRVHMDIYEMSGQLEKQEQLNRQQRASQKQMMKMPAAQ